MTLPDWLRSPLSHPTISSGQTAKAGVKAAGAVIDDAVVTPRYVDSFTAERELPIVGAIARASIKNKLIILLSAALVLSTFLPWAITPLLMIGGAYLCYEGAEKVSMLSHRIRPRRTRPGWSPSPSMQRLWRIRRSLGPYRPISFSPPRS